MKRLSNTVLLASMVLSMGATDALAQRAGRTRGPARPRQVQQQQVAHPQAPAQWSRAYQRVAMYRSMQTQSIHWRTTPPMYLVANNDSVHFVQTRQSNYEKDITHAFDVSNLGASGVLDVTALLPVSAHTGQAEQFAKTNQYNMVIRHADGTVETLAKTPSTGLVTEKTLSIHLKPGRTLLQFWAEGSGGVGGYRAGREIELNWDGK